MLNEKFKIRMSRLLGNDYPDFINAIESERAVRGVRINPLKCKCSDIILKSDFSLTPLSYAKEGFILGNHEGIGNTPEHHCGMIYIQDPGAMASLCALDIKEGWRVLDMCSAPGGKSGQAAAKIGESGFLLSNEYVPKRAKIVVSNFERLGVKNAIVTSYDTEELPRLFRGFFDLVIADVPCSGEGMFRKSEEALSEWSEENVLMCARRQSEILNNAPSLVKPGGYLLYSTCTYSLEENEMTVDAFLSKNPDFSLVPVRDELRLATADGIVFDGAKHAELKYCRRFYPHVSKGEGQFIALMQKDKDSETSEAVLYKDAAKEPSREEKAALESFFKQNLKERPQGRLAKSADNLVILTHGMPIPQKSVFSAGVLLGTYEKGVFKPSHQFFTAFANLFLRQENLMCGDARVNAYLRGEEIDAKEFSDSGYCAVLYEGVALGGGKASLGKIKNHYPKGLRNK